MSCLRLHDDLNQIVGPQFPVLVIQARRLHGLPFWWDLWTISWLSLTVYSNSFIYRYVTFVLVLSAWQMRSFNSWVWILPTNHNKAIHFFIFFTKLNTIFFFILVCLIALIHKKNRANYSVNNMMCKTLFYSKSCGAYSEILWYIFYN